MDLNVQNWKEFSILQLFNKVEIAKSADIGNLEDGTIPFIGRTDIDNGVQGFVSPKHITKGCCITISMVGTNVALYQENDFQASQNIAILRRKGMTKAIALFICSLINFEMKLKYSYGRTVGKTNIEQMILHLPVDSEGNPDWQFMDDYIKSLHYKRLTTQNKAGNVPDLNVQNWKPFRIGDIFKLIRGHNLTLDQKEQFIGSIPCINGTVDFNGIQCYLSKELEYFGFRLFKAPAITIVRVGNGGKSFVQTDDFFVADNAFVLVPYCFLSKYSLFFLSSVLDKEQFKYSYGRTVTSDYENTEIRLPIDSTGNPDWQFMEDYIKALPYGDRLAG